MTLLINVCSEKLSELEFVRPIENILGVKAKHHTKISTEDVAKADKIVIAGTALKDFKYLEGDFSWLKQTDKPVLGICAGMQLIAEAFGIPLEEFTTIGPNKVEVVAENKLASGEFNAYFLHTKTGTGNFKVLAKSEGKPCMIKHPEKEIYGCIFHPEVMNQEIIENF